MKVVLLKIGENNYFLVSIPDLIQSDDWLSFEMSGRNLEIGSQFFKNQNLILERLYLDKPLDESAISQVETAFLKLNKMYFPRLPKEQNTDKNVMRASNTFDLEVFNTISHTKADRDNEDQLDLSQIKRWKEFSAVFEVLLSKVMAQGQARRFISRILSQKELKYGPKVSEIGNIAREIILEIPHRKKRKLLLTELYELLLKTGIDKTQDNIIGFRAL